MLKTEPSMGVSPIRSEGRRRIARRRSVIHELFPPEYELLPQVNQIYELELAWAEYQALTEDELVTRGAYCRSINGRTTHHFHICMNTPEQYNVAASRRRKNFFAANLFAVGYATHGLFPYRGKFHPQMIKAIMNIIGLRPGDVVLDPMVGCGTTLIEASIIGINSIGVEISPFAALMSEAKLGGLEMDCERFPQLLERADEIFDFFSRRQGASYQLPLASLGGPLDLAGLFEEQPALYKLILLCYLDTMGYTRRQKSRTAQELFPEVLKRYFAAVRAFNESRQELGLTIGSSCVVIGDARRLGLPDASVDGIIFSPPYSFAIDYLENDRPQLEYLGVDVDAIKANLVGLRGDGRTRRERIKIRVRNYFEDMDRILAECSRVLRPERFCVIVVGSNINQTGGIALEEKIIELGEGHALPLDFRIVRQIEGIRNTMRNEHLLFFRKANSNSP
ncbi:MAG TPA: hypothetical protein EYP55_07125 [Anaerolineae bacterium]|nr:hypothetical protein [Anaerolineae bacterium]